jgi:tripartite-type tricarboxylate transporter receptor subunit TctC
MDSMTRAFLPVVAQQLNGTNFVIINRPGAGGQQAFEFMVAATPDGYTLGAAQAPNAIIAPIERAVRYRVQDFTFLGNLVDDPCGLWVQPDSPIRDLPDLIERAKQQPEQITVGNAGVGTDDHQLALSVEEATGARFLHVPYTGTPPIITGLLSRSIEVGSFNMSEGQALLRQGALRPLAQGGAERWSGTGSVPTIREQGIDVVAGSTRGLVGPPNLPTAIRDALRDAVAAANTDPGWIAASDRLNLPRRPLSAEAQQALFFEEDARLRALWSRKPWRD